MGQITQLNTPVDLKMQRLAILAVLLGAAAALKLPTMTKEEVEAKFGPVNWNPDVKTTYCNKCSAISIESSGGALQYQPNRLGRFSVAGALWENMVPLFKASNGQYMTPDPNSNPVIYYLKWVISETVGGFNAGVQNNAYTDGIHCPWDIPDNWEYEYQRQWFVDPTLKVTSVQFRNQFYFYLSRWIFFHISIV